MARHPVAGLAIGALCVSASAVLIELSGGSPGTASFYRCLLALPALLPLAFVERKGTGAPTSRRRWTAVAAGVLFAGDMVLWTQAIPEIGAGLSTVLVNVQVILVPALGWLVDREPVTRRYLAALPAVVTGVVLTAGVSDHGGPGTAPGLGVVHAVLAALCYSGFLFLLRRSGHDGRVRQTYAEVTVTAAVVSLPAGLLWGGVTLAPGWAAIGWLAVAAVCGQVFGWLLVAVNAPRLRGDVAAVLLLLTPVGAMILGALVLGERPTLPQLCGCGLILAGAVITAFRAGTRRGRELAEGTVPGVYTER
ncbi:DMT family transporter [Amycolatopsis pigmentata]|uniref:DMT family transporter n=1 Tax=Amycolatopsis pigmentata TaxID=450801 RepID=A0ABW5FZI0_9PSEU